MKKNKTKYNVDISKEKRTYNNIVFDSVLEMKYYRDVILPNMENGLISKVELQKPYELQPKFTKNNKSVKAIMYIADFYIEYFNGVSKVIDIKGMPDNVAKLKRKLFWYKYPNIDYVWIGYSKCDGGWLPYEEILKARKARRQQRKYKNEYQENYYSKNLK